MADRKEILEMDPEEYSEFKRQEKDEVFEMLSDATQKLVSGSYLRSYADMQAKLLNHSVSNVLLIMEQMPEATWVRTHDDWNKDNVMVLKGETGIKALGPQIYQREDGTIGKGSKVVKAFDVSQTNIKDLDIRRPSYRNVPDVIGLAYPAAVEADLPGGVDALYDPKDVLIRYRHGLDPAAKLFAVAREHAVQFMMGDEVFSREEVIDRSEMAAYILTKHYGYEAPEIGFGEMSSKYPGKEESEVRGQLGIIKHTAETIDSRVQEALALNRMDKQREER